MAAREPQQPPCQIQAKMDRPKSTYHCKLLRCALEVIDSSKSADGVRITTAPDFSGRFKDAKTPCQHDQDQDLDRVQRRKEKKRRKVELRKQQQDMIQSKLVTSTAFTECSADTIVASTIPESIKVITVKPLIILDVNGILCHRLRHKSLKQTPSKGIIKFRPSIGHIANTDIVPRSDLYEFISMLNKHFCLAVWTSATKKTAKQLVQVLFPEEIREKLVFIWHRNFCNIVDISDRKQRIGSAELELKMNSNSNVEGEKKSSHEDLIAIKSLAKVWASYPIWNDTNTLLLDDSPEKCPTRYRKNSLHPTKICGTVTEINGGAYMDNDEKNQSNQRCFFEHLAKSWSETSPPEYLPSFLESNANNYNMGWCLKEIQQSN